MQIYYGNLQKVALESLQFDVFMMTGIRRQYSAASMYRELSVVFMTNGFNSHVIAFFHPLTCA